MKTKQKVKMVLFQLSYAEEFIWKNSDQITRRTTQTNPKEREREREREIVYLVCTFNNKICVHFALQTMHSIVLLTANQW